MTNKIEALRELLERVLTEVSGSVTADLYEDIRAAIRPLKHEDQQRHDSVYADAAEFFWMTRPCGWGGDRQEQQNAEWLRLISPGCLMAQYRAWATSYKAAVETSKPVDKDLANALAEGGPAPKPIIRDGTSYLETLQARLNSNGELEQPIVINQAMEEVMIKISRTQAEEIRQNFAEQLEFIRSANAGRIDMPWVKDNALIPPETPTQERAELHLKWLQALTKVAEILEMQVGESISDAPTVLRKRLTKLEADLEQARGNWQRSIDRENELNKELHENLSKVVVVLPESLSAGPKGEIKLLDYHAVKAAIKRAGCIIEGDDHDE